MRTREMSGLVIGCVLGVSAGFLVGKDAARERLSEQEAHLHTACVMAWSLASDGHDDVFLKSITSSCPAGSIKIGIGLRAEVDSFRWGSPPTLGGTDAPE